MQFKTIYVHLIVLFVHITLRYLSLQLIYLLSYIFIHSSNYTFIFASIYYLYLFIHLSHPPLPPPCVHSLGEWAIFTGETVICWYVQCASLDQFCARVAAPCARDAVRLARALSLSLSRSDLSDLDAEINKHRRKLENGEQEKKCEYIHTKVTEK